MSNHKFLLSDQELDALYEILSGVYELIPEDEIMASYFKNRDQFLAGRRAYKKVHRIYYDNLRSKGLL